MKKSEVYQGRLTAEQTAIGMNAAIDNARRLAQDARYLLDAGRLPSAAALAGLSIEESGKTSVLRGLVLARDEQELKSSWKAYRSHTSKNVAWIFPLIVSQGGRVLEDFKFLFAKDSDHPRFLDDLKQLAFYTDCLVDANWSVPWEAVEADTASLLVTTAELFAQASSITAREIELWVEHVAPVWKGPMEWMKSALIHWDAAMRAEGLSSDDRKVTMEEFVRAERPADT